MTLPLVWISLSQWKLQCLFLCIVLEATDAGRWMGLPIQNINPRWQTRHTHRCSRMKWSIEEFVTHFRHSQTLRHVYNRCRPVSVSFVLQRVSIYVIQRCLTIALDPQMCKLPVRDILYPFDQNTHLSALNHFLTRPIS